MEVYPESFLAIMESFPFDYVVRGPESVRVVDAERGRESDGVKG